MASVQGYNATKAQYEDIQLNVDGDIKVSSNPEIGTPTVYNVTLTSADTEYSQAMVTNCRRFEFQARTDVAVRFAYVTGKVAGPANPYVTLKAGDVYDSGPINQSRRFAQYVVFSLRDRGHCDRNDSVELNHAHT